MNDDQFSRELSRRAGAADVPDLLPAVRSGIDTRPTPVDSSRLAPLAGLVGVVAALLLLVIALPRIGPGDAQPSPSGGPVSATARDGDFSLTITAARSHYAVDEPIEVEASLVYDGDQSETTVGGANTLLGFGIEEVDGRLRMEPAFDASCTPHTLSAGVPLVEPFSKSGGWSDDDPLADFWRAYFSDPLLHLPAGTWRIWALATFGLDECRSVTTLEASVLIRVGSEQEPEPTPELPTPVTQATPALTPRQFDCPPVRESLGDVAPTVIDETGLVQRCVAATPAGGPPVSNPGGDQSVLHLEWSGSSCDAAATISLGGTAGSYDVRITPAAGFCRLLLAPYAIQLELSGQIAAEEVNLTHGESPELGPAWWELAAHERPTAESTTLDVVVYERACASGQAPEGRIVGPEIEYDIGVISITFHVEPLAGAGDCQLAAGVPMTVALSEPLGDRRINDGGFNSVDVVMEASDELLAISSSRVDELAYERFEAMVGGQQCTSTVTYDRYVPTQQELKAAADALESEEGFIEYGGYVSDSWLSAARAFGAIEAYGGRPKPWYIVTPGEPLTLAPLDPFPISGDRTVWFAGFYQAVVRTSDCQAPIPTQPPAVPESIACPSAEGQPAEVSLVDHSGLVSSCDAFVEPASEEFLSVTNVGLDESTLEVRWEIGAVCSSMPVQLELWGPFDYEFSGGLPNYALQVDERPTDGPVGCRDVVASQGVRLALRSAVPAREVAAFRTSGTRGLGQGRVGEHTLTVELVSDRLEYASGQPIDISASILYSGPRSEVTLTGFDPNPAFGFQQLDGLVRQGPGADWNCESVELERDVPLVLPFEKQGVFIADELSDTPAVDAYWANPELRLSPGLYRFFVRFGGNLDGSCYGREGRAVGATASVVVTVR